MLRLIILTLFIGLTSCGYFTDELEQTDLASAEIDATCLDGLVDSQVQYLTNKGSLAGALAGIDCAKDLLKLANGIFRGQEQERSLTAEEAAGLANGTVLVDNPIPVELMKDALILKSWFLGGSPETFTSQDIDNIINLLTQWQEFLKDVDHLIPIINWEKGQGNEADLRAAQEQFTERFIGFVSNLPPYIDPFDIEVLKRFVSGIAEYTNSEDYSRFLDLFHGILLIINGSGDRIDMQNTARAFLIFYFEYKFFTYKFDMSFTDLVTRPLEYAQWIGETATKMGSAVGQNLSLTNEGWKYIYDFLVGG